MSTAVDETPPFTPGPAVHHHAAPEPEPEPLELGSVPVRLLLEVQVPRRTWATAGAGTDEQIAQRFARWVQDRIVDGAAYLLSERITAIGLPPERPPTAAGLQD